MALTGALFSGVSGLNTNGNAMNIIGDNIANVNTVGFKAARAIFFDLLSAEIGGAKVGTGSRLAGAARSFVQGGVETTSSPTDMTVQGRGFFILKDSKGSNFFSRAGQFTLDKGAALVNPQGLKVQGVKLDSNGIPTSGLSAIIVNNQSLVAPTETSTLTLVANVDATTTTSGTGFTVGDKAGNEADPATYFSDADFSTVLTVFDSLGQAHDLTFLFDKTAASTWAYRVVANGGEITGGTAGKLRQVSAAGATLKFKTDGTLNTTASTFTKLQSTTSATGIIWNNGAATQILSSSKVGFTGTTQFALPSSVSSLSQNGAEAGTITGISIGEEGIITGLFSSGRTQPLFRVSLADFTNPEGLTHVGNSLFTQSASSGQAILSNPGNGGFGTILSGSLELSTVDLAAEFVKMVTTQRGFQASARTITVTDSLLDEVANLKR